MIKKISFGIFTAVFLGLGILQYIYVPDSDPFWPRPHDIFASLASNSSDQEFSEQTTKDLYKACLAKMAAQRYEKNKREAFCSCSVYGTTVLFEPNEIERAKRAEPSPDGDTYQKRMAEVVSRCSYILRD